MVAMLNDFILPSEQLLLLEQQSCSCVQLNIQQLHEGGGG